MSFWGAVAKAGVDIAGKVYDATQNRKNLNRQLNLQNDLARQSVQIRVADAKAAGIHPLYALGSPGISISPVSVGSSTLGQGISDSLIRAGQDISRSNFTNKTQADRTSDALQALSVERAGLENDLLRSKIAQFNSAQVPPAVPAVSIGQGSVEVVPKQVTSSSADTFGAAEAGVSPSLSWLKNQDGSVSQARSVDATQRLEEDFVGGAQFALRNNIMPFVTGAPAAIPPASLLPKGAYMWDYNQFTNTFTPVYRTDTRHVPRPYRKPRGIKIPRDRRSRNPFTGY